MKVNFNIKSKELLSQFSSFVSVSHCEMLKQIQHPVPHLQLPATHLLNDFQTEYETEVKFKFRDISMELQRVFF